MLAHVNGWTPVIDNIVYEYGTITALVFGVVWRHCQMRNGVCSASQDRLAKHVGLSRQSINTHINKLVEGGYLRDLTPELKNRPHVYQDTGKASVTVNIDATVNGSDSTIKDIDSTIKEVDSNTLSNTQLVDDKKSNSSATATTFQPRKNGSAGRKYKTLTNKVADIVMEQNRIPDVDAINKAIVSWNNKCAVANAELPPELQWSNTNYDAILEQYDIIVLSSS